MGAPGDVAEPVGEFDFPMQVSGFVCFHCGEEFTLKSHGSSLAAIRAATEHFGPDPRWKPGCHEMLMAPRKLWRRMRLAEMRLAEIGRDAEELDDLRETTAVLARERDALRNRVDSLEGELEVERLRLKEAR